MGDKTHPFTISMCNTFMQKVRVETSHRGKSKLLVCAEKHKAGEKVSIVTNWEVERVGSRAEVILDGKAQCTQASVDMVLVADYFFKRGGVGFCRHFSEGGCFTWKKSSPPIPSDEAVQAVRVPFA